MMDFLTDLEIGEEAFFLSNLKVYPVFARQDGISAATLQEVLEAGGGKVLETGTVEEVEVEYHWDDPLFVMDGEEIIGARQNRIFITSMLLNRGRRRVPVACVEEGRWSGAGEFRLSGYIAYPRLRSVNTLAVTESLRKRGSFETNQQSIWKEVSTKLKTMKVMSRTRAMTESFRSAEARLSPYTDFQPQENQVGFFVYSNYRFLAADVFGSSELFRKFATRLLQSYGLDALEDTERSGGRRVKPPTELMTSLRDKDPDIVKPGVGAGEEIRLILSGLILKALIYRRALVHFSLFPR